MTNWEAGMKVRVRWGASDERIHNIARVTKTLVVLDNGTRYNMSGRQIGVSSYQTKDIYPATAEDLKRVKLRVIAQNLGRVKWAELDEDTLIRVGELVLKNPKAVE